MAKFAGHFTDALVVIYDKNNNLITKTIVTGHDRGEMYIEVTEGLENVRPGTRLHLLIIHSNGASEFGGTLKSVRQGIYEIPIFGERRRGAARGATRYALNAKASIRDITINSETVTLSDPIQVTIENISKTGLLFKSPELRFILNAAAQIEFDVNGRNTVLIGRVVREQRNEDSTYSFGCRLVFLR